MVRNKLIIIFLLLSVYGKAQKVVINLQDTMEIVNKISYTFRGEGGDVGSFSFDTTILMMYELKGKVKHLQVENFIYTNSLEGERYNNIHYIEANKNGQNYLLFDMNGDSLFAETECVIPFLGKNKVVLQFFPKEKKAIDRLNVPVYFMKGDRSKRVSFFTYKLETGHFSLENKDYNISVWPYQLGTTINVDTTLGYETLQNIKYYRLLEHFFIGDNVLVFKNYDFERKTIELHITKKKKVLYGYKPGSFLKDWSDTTVVKKEDLGIEKNKAYLIYFGAKWCGWCKPELVKLKKIYPVLEHNNIGLLTITAQHKESIEELERYIQDNQVMGISKIESMAEESSLINVLHITTYPSYVFVDKKGKILFRSDYKEQELSEFMYNYLGKNKS